MMQMDETAIKKEHENGVSIIEPTQKTVDSLMKIDLPAGVDIEIKL